MTHGFVVPSDTRVNALSIGEMVLCVVHLWVQLLYRASGCLLCLVGSGSIVYLLQCRSAVVHANWPSFSRLLQILGIAR